MSDYNDEASRVAADSADRKAQAEAFKKNARDEALSAAEKGLQAAREALELAERKLAEAQRHAAYDRAQQAQASGDDPISVDFEDRGSVKRDTREQENSQPYSDASSQAYAQQPGGFQATSSDVQAAQCGTQSAAQPTNQPGTQNGAQAVQSGPQPYAQPSAYAYQANQTAQPGTQGNPQQPYGGQGFYQQPPVQPHYSAPYTTPKDHVAAGLLAIFLGCLGVHKFYLGYSTQGFIMLAISVLGGILSIGLATSIVWIVAIVEGIIYLSKSQSEFEQLYVYGKHEWF